MIMRAKGLKSVLKC